MLSELRRRFALWVCPELAEPVEAIKFAVEIDDHFDRLYFLNSWLHGDLGDWPEYRAALDQGGE